MPSLAPLALQRLEAARHRQRQLLTQSCWRSRVEHHPVEVQRCPLTLLSWAVSLLLYLLALQAHRASNIPARLEERLRRLQRMRWRTMILQTLQAVRCSPWLRHLRPLLSQLLAREVLGHLQLRDSLQQRRLLVYSRWATALFRHHPWACRCEGVMKAVGVALAVFRAGAHRVEPLKLRNRACQ